MSEAEETVAAVAKDHRHPRVCCLSMLCMALDRVTRTWGARWKMGLGQRCESWWMSWMGSRSKGNLS